MDGPAPGEDDRRFEWQVVLDDADYRMIALAYGDQQRRGDMGTPKWLIVVSWLVFCLALIAVFSMVERDFLTAGFIGFIGGVVGIFLASTIYNRLAMPRAIEQLSGTKGVTIAVAIDAAGVESRTDENFVWFAWSGIKSVSQTDTHYLMWPKSLYALALPKRVLRDADEASRFARALADWHPQAAADSH